MLLNGLHRPPTPEEAIRLAAIGGVGVPVTMVLGAAPHHDRAPRLSGWAAPIGFEGDCPLSTIAAGSPQAAWLVLDPRTLQ